MTKMDWLPPVHPGEVLREEYLAPLGITPYALAAALRLSRTHVERLVREEISLTANTALRLAGYFGTSPEFWLGIRARFDEHAVTYGLNAACYATANARLANASRPAQTARRHVANGGEAATMSEKPRES